MDYLMPHPAALQTRGDQHSSSMRGSACVLIKTSRAERDCEKMAPGCRPRQKEEWEACSANRAATIGGEREDLEPEPETARNEMGTIIQCKRWTMCPIGELTFPLVIRHEVFVFRKQKHLLADIRANAPINW